MTLYSDAEPDWPKLDELKQWRDVDSDDWDGLDLTRFTAELVSAIEYVKDQVGDWDELVDVPDVRLSRAAMRMAVLLRENAGAEPDALSRDRVFQAYMRGHRRRFGIA